MKKRFIALLLCCVMIFTLSPSLISAASATDINGTTVETPTDEPTAEPTVETPTDEPTAEPTVETPTDEPTAEPKTEEPKAEEPKAEEPKAEEPKAEEPKAEEPKAEDETTIPAAEQPGAPVESEIITPTVNFTNVAPFLPPVSGGVRMLRAPLAARAAANFAANDAANDTATDNGMKISKTATANNDGSYTITLEAYATGSKVISEVKEDVPTDIILVLDQSGSMAEDMSTYDFRKYTGKSNSDFYALRHNGARNPNLYHKLDDGSYATVSVTRTRTYTYTPCPSDWQNDRKGSFGDWNPDDYWKYSENLYVKDEVGEYQKVTVTYQYDWSIHDYVYTYTFPNGNTVTSNGDSEQPGSKNFDGNGPVYYATTTSEYTYTYTYTDKAGNLQTIGTSTGANTQPTDFTLYERYSTGSVTRLQALKTAVTNFAEEVAKKAAGKDGNIDTTEDNINHRIAVVGFASSGTEYNRNKYENTEVFVGATQYTYGTSAQSQYGNALQSMNTVAGQNNITNSIGALDAYGGTFTDLGMEMANGIFARNPITDEQKRNRVIIVFTDGYPGTGDSVDDTVANDAVSQGYTAKQSTANDGYGATVYTVGIFSGADGTPVESLSSVSNPNKFMHLLSSNYKNAKSYSDSSKYGTATYPAGGDSYYLSAADADSLNSIFEQISKQIEDGGSASTLTEESVIKDIISPQFTLPEGATASSITLETYRCTGKNANGDYTWSKNADAMGAKATVNGDTVSITGFDFAENYVGTVTENGNVSYRGHKLVISFTVSPKAGFLGGNSVITNTNAGIYENSTAVTPVLTFDQPQVNVPIEDVTVTATDKNVYLKGEVTADQLKDGSEISVGDVKLDLSKATDTDKPYGLDPWQTEYVNITVTVKDKDGNVISDKLENLTEDTTYTVKVTVAPKTTEPTSTEGTKAETKNGSDDANINVFKPVLTFQDSEVYYGDTAPDYTGNLTDTEWKHGETLSDAEGVTMIGTAPTLTLTYTPEAGKIDASNKINTKQDIAVDVAVKIDGTNVTGHTTFNHTACNPACGWNKTTLDGSPAFLLHVKTCQLTITKTDGTDGEPYVFTVKKDGKKYTEVTIVGSDSETIYELPVGTYTVAEDTGWSWRYPNPTYTPINGVKLSAESDSGTITCTNSLSKPYWLNGFSTVVENVYGVQQ